MTKNTPHPKIFFLIYLFISFVVLVHLIESSVVDDEINLNALILWLIMTILSSFSWWIYQKIKLIKTEMVICLVFNIFVILIDSLLLENLPENSKINIIMYLLSVYFVLFEKINKYYSILSINFLIIYTSFKSLQLYNEPASLLICNFALIFFQMFNLLIIRRKWNRN